jgi:hypothetical protein
VTALDDAYNAAELVWGSPTLLVNWRGDEGGPADIYTPPIKDTFARPDTGGVVSNGWGVSDNGYTWTCSVPADAAVSGGTGKLNITALNSTRTAFIGWNGHHAGYESRYDFRISVLPTGNSVRHRFHLARLDALNSTIVQVDFATTAGVGWSILRNNNNTLTTLATGAFGLTHAAGNWYSMRVQLIPAGSSATIRFRFWAQGTTEPTAWSGTTTDPLTVWAGTIAQQFYAQTGNTNTLPIIGEVANFTNVAIDRLYPGSWNTNLSMDTGVPSEVNTVSASGVPDLGANLMPPTGWNSASDYFSKQNTTSPVYGFDRDVPLVTLDVPIITSTGPQTSRVFTGQMTDIPTDTETASLGAISRSRNMLRRAIQLPPIDADTWALNSGSLVDMLAYKCGLSSGFPIPPLVSPGVSSVKLWMPMHGTVMPYNYGANYAQDTLFAVGYIQADASGILTTGPQGHFTTGPFVSAIDASLSTTLDRHFVYSGIITDNGGYPAPQENYTAALFSTNPGHGLCQAMWYVRGDAVTTPGPLGTPSKLSGFEFQTSFPTSLVTVSAGVSVARNVFITFNDGVNTRTLTSAGTVPNDGLWHKVGVFWDINGNALKVYLDGTVGSLTPSPAISLTNIPAAFYDYYTNGYPEFRTFLPASDVVILCGTPANPTVGGWIADRAMTDPSVMMRPGLQPLAAYAMTTPREAFSVISELAQGELAWTGFDANDSLNYLPMSYWVEPAQQPVSPSVLSTQADIVAGTPAAVGGDLVVTRDVTKIYNQVAVGYQQQTKSVYSVLYQSTTGLPIPPGTTVYRFNFANPALGSDVFNFSPIQFSQIPTILAARLTYYVLNGAADGSGAEYLTTFPAGAVTTTEVFDSGGLTVTFRNADYRTWYISSNDSSKPPITIFGTALIEAEGTVYAQDDASVNGRRGPRSLSVSLPAVKSYAWGLFIATELAARYANPRLTVAASVMPDLRRKAGDMVRIVDPAQGLNERFRLVAINTSGEPGDIRQSVIAEEAWQVGVWDQDAWDAGVLWGA